MEDLIMKTNEKFFEDYDLDNLYNGDEDELHVATFGQDPSVWYN